MTELLRPKLGMSGEKPVNMRVRFRDQFAVEHVPEDHVALLLIPATDVDCGRWHQLLLVVVRR